MREILTHIMEDKSVLRPVPRVSIFETHSRKKCMDCANAPTIEVKWAEGMAHAWFCDDHYKSWSAEHKDDIDYVKKITTGEASKKFSDNKNPNIKEHDEHEMADKINDLIKIQSNDPIVQEEEYFRGLGNGLIVAKAVVDGEEPKFIDKVKESEQSEAEKYFEERTNRHIDLVKKAAEKIADANPEFKEFWGNELLDNVENHDQSKLQEPERAPYIDITWRHKLEKETGEFDPINGKGYQTPGKLSKDSENQATLHHVTTNDHHPEHWIKDKSEANINAENRDKSDNVVDASAMPDVAIAEMVADWQAMAEELKKNTARQWYNSVKDVRWHFSDHQDDLIDRLLKVFEKIEEKDIFKGANKKELFQRNPVATFEVYVDGRGQGEWFDHYKDALTHAKKLVGTASVTVFEYPIKDSEPDRGKGVARWSSKPVSEKDVFQPASQEDITKRREDAMAANMDKIRPMVQKLELILQQLGFGMTDLDYSMENGIVFMTGTNGTLTIKFKVNVGQDGWKQTQRLEVAMNDGDNYDRMYLAFKLNTSILVKKIQDHMIPKFAEGDVGWSARYTPKARYKRYCAVCGANIPTGTRHMRMASGGTVCANCVRRASGALGEGVWIGDKTTILNEEDVFKPASEEELSTRQADYEAAHKKEMFDRAERIFPGCVAKLKSHFKDDAVVEAAIAYADTTVVQDILDIKPYPNDMTISNNKSYKIRELDWTGVWTDGPTFIRQAEIIESYNVFDVDIARAIVRDFPDKKFRLGREGSVALYIRPVLDIDMDEHYDAGQDELSVDGDTLRLWWD